MVSSQLVYPEARALAAAARAARIDESTHGSRVVTVEDLYAHCRPSRSTNHWPATPATSPRNTPCAAFDAADLTCARQLHGEDILLATRDNALNAAARAAGQPLANNTA